MSIELAVQAQSNAAPDPNDLFEWALRLDADWGVGLGPVGGFITEVQREKDTYFQHFTVEAPGGRDGVKSGSAPSDADAAIDSLVPSDVMVSVKPARNRKKYQRQASKLSYFGRATIAAWRKRRDVLRQLASDQVISRVAVARVMFDHTLWPEMPKDLVDVNDDSEEDIDPATWKKSRQRWIAKNRNKYPIILERRDPRTVRWKMADDGELLVVVERYYTTVLEAHRVYWDAYPKSREVLSGLELNDRVLVTDVWYGKWRALFLEETPIFPLKGVVPHLYQEIPYAIMPFRELPFDAPHEKYRGMLSNSQQLYEVESRVLTMTVWLLRWNAWRTYVGHTNDKDRTIEIVPGTMIDIDERQGEYLRMLEGNVIPPEIFNVINTIDAYVQRNGVAQGPRTAEGTRSAQQLWGIQAMRQLKIECAKDAMQRGIERCLMLAAQILETMLKEPVTLPLSGKDREGNDLGEVEVSPDDIDGYWDAFKVSFSRRLDPALLEQSKALQALATNNWMPLRQSIELSGLADDPQEWLDELTLQNIERLPFIIELCGLQLAKNFYGEDAEEYRMLMQQVLLGQLSRAGGGPGQAPPGAPGVPTGGNTPPSPTGTPTEPPGGAGGTLADTGGQQSSARPSGNTRRMPPTSSNGVA